MAERPSPPRTRETGVREQGGAEPGDGNSRPAEVRRPPQRGAALASIHAGFAVRRVPPPGSDPADDVPCRIEDRTSAPTSYGGSMNRPAALNVCATLFPRQQRHSLYSLRHQFIANMTTIYEPAEIAALVGHVTNETAVEHYSKRRTAWQQHHIRDVPIPMPDQVAQMRKRLKMFDDRRPSRLARRDLIERRPAAKAKNEEL